MSSSPKKRRWPFVVVAAVLAFTVWAIATYPKVGQLSFAAGAALEAKFYGLSKERITIGELDMVTYVGGPVDAPAIVMVHGYTADKEVWPRLAKHFIDDFRVVIPDLAGHGETEFNPAWDYGIPAQTLRVKQLMDALKIDKAHIIGNSMGGHIVGQFAISYPERTLTVTPVDPAGVPSRIPSEADSMRAENPDNNPFFVNERSEFRTLYPMTMARPPWLPGFVIDAIGEQYAQRLNSYKRIWADFHNSPELTERLGEIRMPALLFWGDQDRLLHVSATEAWAAAVPHLQVEILPGIGHMPMVEVPALVAERYRRFLQDAKL